MKNKLALLLIGAITGITQHGYSQPMDMQTMGTHVNTYLLMMDTMMQKMTNVPAPVSAESDFNWQMIAHHEGAVQMARYEIVHGRDFSMIQLAKSILAEQQVEIQQMHLWLNEHPDRGPVPADYRNAMALSMSEMMNGMPPDNTLIDPDNAFARVMIPHHKAAQAMAAVMLTYSNDRQTVGFSRQLISNEEIEIEQLLAFANPQTVYQYDRVYTANQVSNTISVVNPATNELLGEIRLGKPYPNVLSPLYRGQALVHGLRYSRQNRMLAAVGIGSNSVTLISTLNNKILKTIYVGRSPHEPTFTPDGKQIWVSVRGEAYISVIDVATMKEIRQVPVADGPGMVAFTPDGKLAYVCSSFTPELDIVNTVTYAIVKRIPVVSPFSPNIFTSPDGKWIAMTHKDVGKVTVINTAEQAVVKILNTGAITNHVTFTHIAHKLLMLVTVGGENKLRVFDVAAGFQQTDTVNVGALPHGVWTSPDGKRAYIGLEYGDQVQAIDLDLMQVIATIPIGQSPQALVYADDAVTDGTNRQGLSPLNDSTATRVIVLKSGDSGNTAIGRLAVRSIGLTDLIEQIITGLQPNTAYTLALTRSETPPYTSEFQINTFTTDQNGKYMGQSTGLINTLDYNAGPAFKHVILLETSSKKLVLTDDNK
jgi:YVTN family beta-propeller protein